MLVNVVGVALLDQIAWDVEREDRLPKELRVHGVSGTPPSALLYTNPVTYDQGWDLAKVYEPNRDDWEVKGFHWGSLTSRSSLTAFWILLAPFAMANVAGWMSEVPNIWSRIWIRVAGLALTGILFAQTANMGFDIPISTGLSHTAVLWLYAGMCLVLVLGFGMLSTQSTFKPLSVIERMRYLFAPTVGSMNPARMEPDWSDPTGAAKLVGFGMWSVHSVIHRLRRLHLTFGMAILALVAARAVENAFVEGASLVVVGVTMVALAYTVGITAPNPLVLWVTALAPVTGVGLLAWGLASMVNGEIVGVNVADDLTFEIALVLGIAAGLGLTGEMVLSKARRGWVPMGLLAIAAMVGSTLGLTGAMLVENYLSDTPDTSHTFDAGASFVTVGMLGLVLVVAAAFVIAMFLPANSASVSRIRRAVLRVRGVLAAAGVYGGLVGAVAVYLSCTGAKQGCTQTNISLPMWVLESGDNFSILFGIPFDPASVLGWAKLLMIAVPALLIVRSIVGGLLNGQDARRQVGILWDLGSFWPRWFHPLAPPAYGPYAVTRMQTMIDNEKPDVLTAHSQGSLIAAVAICLADVDHTPGCFISYGSQMGELYPALFPGVAFDELTATTDAQLGGKWLNLWRADDPIGGHLVARLGDRNWQVNTGSGHSAYELTPEFCAARDAAISGDLGKPAENVIARCWERD